MDPPERHKAVTFYVICVKTKDFHFINSSTRTSRDEWEYGKDCSKQDKKCVWTIVGGGGGAEPSHLRAVVKPPEEGQCSGVTWPNHCSQISLLPPDGYNRSGEIYTLHWTCGNNTYVQAHVCIQINVHTHKFSQH